MTKTYSPAQPVRTAKLLISRSAMKSLACIVLDCENVGLRFEDMSVSMLGRPWDICLEGTKRSD